MTAIEAYHIWNDADFIWQTALNKAFGKDGCNRRYDIDKKSHPSYCRECEKTFDNARIVYFAIRDNDNMPTAS